LGGVGVGRNCGCSGSRKEFWVGSESEGILGVVEVGRNFWVESEGMLGVVGVGRNFGWSRKELWV
jgi:hypothetical protein